RRRVKGLRHQGHLTPEEQIPSAHIRCRIDGIRIITEQTAAHASVKRANINSTGLLFAANHVEKEMTAIRQKAGIKEIRLLTFQIHLQPCGWHAPCGRPTRYPPPAKRGKKDHALTVPCGANADPDITDRGGESADGLNLFQLAACEEADEAAV